MAKQLQFRRGTTLQNSAFIGAVGEPTLDTETGMIHIHDGVTQGGKEFIDAVVAFQRPTADNNYTWFRKYASGWVEQGGTCSGDSSYIISLPITMADTNFAFYSGTSKNVVDGACITANIDKTYSITTSGFRILCRYGGGNATEQLWWEVKGMAAQGGCDE